jgi:hypothetical protein
MTDRPYITTTEVREHKSDNWSTAPNGSSRNHDFWTVVISRQVWSNDAPAPYAGRVYKIVDRYISSSPDRRGQLVDSSSGPWPADDPEV